ncbi:hypothetical protein UPYG_G00220000 [Umbra pygmaea]|uniref:Calmin n=1 Tax=Umbra pygmaea TaxID=75934 RepID=A0ABD0WBA2_UMBPY
MVGVSWTLLQPTLEILSRCCLFTSSCCVTLVRAVPFFASQVCSGLCRYVQINKRKQCSFTKNRLHGGAFCGPDCNFPQGIVLMAGHEWEYKDWFEREEFIGQISDIRVQNLQVEREVVQKRTFTRWMNLHLEKCSPPLQVNDLFRDIQDGRVLMALLEELSGCKLLHGWKQSSHRIFRLNNIAKVLNFLEERNVKLVSIDAADVADGNSSIVLGLIWNIILFFQIKELTGNIKSQFPSSSSLSSLPTSSDSDTSHSSTPSDERPPSIAMRDHGKAIKTLLQWVQRRTRKYGVAVQDFGRSWTSGLAFLAIIKSIDPSLVDMRRALLRTAKENLEEAFRTAHYSLGIPRLLEPEDVTINPPDEQSIMTYVSQFLEHFPRMEESQENVSDVIQRSVSSGRLSCRVNDSSHDLRNGVHRSRDRERPYIRRDWVQPPPKILISSISEELRSPTSPLAAERSWVTEGSLVGSSPVPTKPSSPQPTCIDSVVSSVSSDSPVSDSVIGSPDSCWEGLTSEAATPERFVESRSDGSLCDSGVSWDMNIPHSTLHGATPDPYDALPSTAELTTRKPQDEELFIDDGNYSLSSGESTRDRVNTDPVGEEEEGRKRSKEELEKEEEEAYNYILDLSDDSPVNQELDESEGNRQRGSDSVRMDISTSQSNEVDKKQGWTSLDISYRPQLNDCDQVMESVFDGECVQQEVPGKRDCVSERTGDSECLTRSSSLAGNPSDGLAPERSDETDCHSDATYRVETESRQNAERGRDGERSLEVPDESPKKQEKSKDVPNGHIESQDNITTGADDVTYSTHSQPYMEMYQSRTNRVALSDPDPKLGNDSHTQPTLASTLPAEAEHDGRDPRGTTKVGLVARTKKCESTPCGGETKMNVIAQQEGKIAENSNKAVDAAGSGASPNTVVKGHHQGKPVSIIPLDMVYYPHYHVPISQVIEAFVEPNPQPVLAGVVPVLETHTQNQSVSISPSQEDIFPALNTEDPAKGGCSQTGASTAEETMGKLADTENIAANSVDVADTGAEQISALGRLDSETKTLFSAVDGNVPPEEQTGETLEPMDLFYPDTDDCGPVEDPEEEADTSPWSSSFSKSVETWPSTFSVAALQPAPSSETETHTQTHTDRHTESQTHGQTETQRETHVRSRTDSHTKNMLELQQFREESAIMQQDKEVEGSEGSLPPNTQERCSMLGQQTVGDWGVLEMMEPKCGPAEPSDLTKEERPASAATARENNEIVRSEADIDGTIDEQCAICSTPLHQKKRSNERDNLKIMSTRQFDSTKSNNSWRELGTGTTLTECYVLLLLWLILYCLLVLPQINYSNLPRLLLNLDE